MDRINQLSDDLLLRILSLVPIIEVFGSIRLVSRKWSSLSSLVSRLDYNDHSFDHADYNKFTGFVYRTLLSNKAPVLDMLYLCLGPKCNDLDIRTWIEIAMNAHRVREVRVLIFSRSSSVSLPRSLFTCPTLEFLVLRNCSVSDINCCCCLRSLKLLALKDVDIASLPKFLSGCPNLKKLVVLVNEEDTPDVITVAALPCLRVLHLRARNNIMGNVYVIEAPCLEILHIVDDVVYDTRRIEYMPNLVKAHVDITQQEVTHAFLRALSSARTLYLCVSLLSEVPSMIICFYRLVHLELNTCVQGWWDLLTQMLQNSPKLASLKLSHEHELKFLSVEPPDYWKRPSSISDSLESFEWSGYNGTRGDSMMATYFIKNVTSLKTAIFSPQPFDFKEKYSIVKDLVSVCTPSPTCRLLFK